MSKETNKQALEMLVTLYASYKSITNHPSFEGFMDWLGTQV